MLQFTRLVFGINSSLFYAQFVSGEHTKKKNPELLEATETVLRSTYMNDSMNSKSNDVETLGFFSPFDVQGKILFQEFQLNGSDWDEPLPLHLNDEIT